jgi:CDP-archaeol synthase
MLRNRFASPLDCGLRFLDGRPLLGPSKTWRGSLFSILITSACAWVEGLDTATGLVFSLAVLLGDSVTSFIKRRLRLVSGGHAPGLDQLLESLLPLLVVQQRFDLALSGILGVVLTFIILNLIFWRYYRPLSLAS